MVYLSLQETEKRRQTEQAHFDGNHTGLEKNRSGQFATPPALAWDVLRLAREYVPPGEKIRFLDPGVGSGVFYSALLDVFGRDRIESAVGFEIDETLIRVAKKLWAPFGLTVRSKDFTRAAIPATESGRFTLIVCNPPYVRHQHLERRSKQHLRGLLATRRGVKLSGLAGLYCYFILLAHDWLTAGGVGFWLVPTEFMYVNYGAVLRQYLLTDVRLRQIHLFDLESVQFSDALVSSCVVVFEKRVPSLQDMVEVTSGPSLLHPDSRTSISVPDLRKVHKWTELAIATNGRRQGIAYSSLELRVGDLFEVRRGIATGANDFFILSVERADDLGLPRAFLVPILPNPRYLSEDRIEADAEGWPIVTPRLALLKCDLPRETIRESYPELDAYLASGEASGLTKRYLLKTRQPWHKQETRLAAPILCTYMGRRKTNGTIFRFLRNYSNAVAPNVYLLLYPKAWLHRFEAESPGVIDLLFSALKQASDEDFLAYGRSYGGGLRKLEPRELAQVPIERNLVDSYTTEWRHLPGFTLSVTVNRD
jgi:adenine-specific DNA-methyltransferase